MFPYVLSVDGGQLTAIRLQLTEDQPLRGFHPVPLARPFFLQGAAWLG